MDHCSINERRTTSVRFQPYPLNETKSESFNSTHPTTSSCCSHVPFSNEQHYSNSFHSDLTSSNRKINVEPSSSSISSHSSPISQPTTPYQHEFHPDFGVPHQFTQPNSVDDALCPTTPNSPGQTNSINSTNDFNFNEPIQLYLNEISTLTLHEDIDALADTYLGGRNETTSTTNDSNIDYNIILNFLYSDDLISSVMCED